MHDPLQRLGLGPDADERAIKRAYAAKLRITRPEEDPQGFQALNEAYQAALSWHRAREAGEFDHAFDDSGEPDADATDTVPAVVIDTRTASSAREVPAPEATPGTMSVPPPETIPAPTPVASADEATANDNGSESEGEPFDVERFFDDCFAAARDGDPRVIDRWLNAQPILWSLQHKATIGHWLLRAMHERTPPMPDRSFDRIAQFFGYHELHGGYDPLALQGLRARVNDAWRWTRQASQPPPVARRVEPPDTGNDPETLRRRRETEAMLAVARQHPHLARAESIASLLWLALDPWQAASIRCLLQTIGGDGMDMNALPPRIDRAQARFWRAVTDPARLSPWRLLVGVLRSAVAALGIVAIVVAGTLLLAPGTLGGLDTLGDVFVSCFSAFTGIWLAYATLRAFLHWQSRPDPEALWHRMLHRMAVPALLLAAGAGTMQSEASPLPILFSVFALVAAIMRRGAAGTASTPARLPRWIRANMHWQHGFLLAILGLATLPALLMSEGFHALVLAVVFLISIVVWALDLRRRMRLSRRKTPSEPQS